MTASMQGSSPSGPDTSVATPPKATRRRSLRQSSSTEVVDDGSDPQTALSFVVCSDKKVHLRRTRSTAGRGTKYLQPDEEFEAVPAGIDDDGREWLQLTGGRGFVSTSSPKDINEMVVCPSDPQIVQWFVVCSDKKVHLRRTCSIDGKGTEYLQPDEEFEATPVPAEKVEDGREWLRLTGGRGFACTTSSKDINKVVVLPSRKRGRDDAASPGQTTQAGKLMGVALLIKERWCNEIFDNGKVWEIRNKPCNKRGRFCIAQSASGNIVGEATMIDCIKVGRVRDGVLGPWNRKSRAQFIGLEANRPKHRIPDLSIILCYANVYAWVLRDAVRYKTPLPYEHRQGCVQWVGLPPELTAQADGADAVIKEEEDEEDEDDTQSSSSDGDSSSSESSSEEKPAEMKSQQTYSPVSETHRESASGEEPAAMKKQRIESLDDVPLAVAFRRQKAAEIKKQRIESPVSEMRQLAGGDQPSDKVVQPDPKNTADQFIDSFFSDCFGPDSVEANAASDDP